MRIEFGSPVMGNLSKEHLDGVVATNWASMGPRVEKLEQEWGKLFDYKYNVAMSSGTDAGINACAVLYDWGAKIGDEVIMPALCFISVANSIRAAGFKPVFVDIEKETMNINPDLIEEKITERTRAIKVVHTMGKPCNMEKIIEIARRHKLHVIEDCCEAHGAKYKGEYVGTYGDMATFSFFAAHVVYAGEGGMVSTNNEIIANVLKSTRNHGREGEFFDHVRFGLNSKMNDMEASIGLDFVSRFWDTFNKRKKNMYYLLEKTKDLREFAWFNLEEPGEVVSGHAFSVLLKNPKYDFKKFHDYIYGKSIKCKRNFGSVPTQHRAFAYLGHKFGEFPEAEYVGSNGLHFGIHENLTQEDLDYISDVLHSYFSVFKGEQE